MNTLSIPGRLFIAILLFSSLATLLGAQSTGCSAADKINDEIRAHNAKYESVKSDLQNGLYCSQCGLSKTELESSGRETFEQHLTKVQGVAVPASQKQRDEAHKRYSDEYDRLKRRFESAITICEEQAKREQERKRQEDERKRKEAERLAEEARKKYEQDQKDAAQKQKAAEEEAKLKKETLEREARDEEERRKLEAQRKAEAQLQQMQEQWARDEAIRQQELEKLRQDMMNLQQAMANRPGHNAEILKEMEETLSQYQNKQIGAETLRGTTFKPGISEWASEKTLDALKEAGGVDDDLFQTGKALHDAYTGGWKQIEEDGIINFFESLGATKAFQFGQTEQLKFTEWLTRMIYEKSLDNFTKGVADIGRMSGGAGQSEPEPFAPVWKAPVAPDNNPVYGQATFWLQSDQRCDNITVSLHEHSGTITQYYAGGAPGCGASGCANFSLPPGNYHYTAQCQDKSWAGDINISEGGCLLMKLN